MRIGILAIGRLKGGAERELVTRYLERARAGGRGLGLTGFETIEFAESRDGDTRRRRDAEAALLVGRMPDRALRVVLDERGTAATSAQLASRIAEWRDGGAGDLVFLVGGPDGHGAAALDGADLTLALGAMTWPHQLVRIMLAEQLYRATTILGGHPYHRT